VLKRFTQVLLFLLVLTCWDLANGQIVANIVHYSTANGLSDNRVTYILRDKSGFMWFGSWAGLNRFDGTNFLNFKSYPGDNSDLRNNRIDEIVEDFENRYLWVRTYDNRVYCFNKRTQQFIPISTLLKGKINDKVTFQRILAVKKNEIWLKTINNGVVWINYSGAVQPEVGANKFRVIVAQNSSFFHLDRLNNAWVGTVSGIIRADKLPDGDRKIYAVKRLLDSTIIGVAEDKDYIWLASAKGSLTAIGLDLKNVRTFNLPTGGINYLLVSKVYPRIYCSTNSGTLYSISSDGIIQKQFQVRSALYAMFEQRSGILWVESQLHGGIRYSPDARELQFPFPKASYDFKPWLWNYTLVEDRDNVVWTNAAEDLRYYNDNTKKLTPFSTKGNPSRQKNIRRLFLDPDGVLWFGSGTQGIEKVVLQDQHFKLRPATQQLTLENLENDIRGLMVDRKNRQWVGTKSGSVHVYQNGKKLQGLFTSEFKNLGGVYCILEDKKNNVWMGTKSGGVLLAKPNGNGQYSVSQFLFNKDFPGSNAIYSLYEDGRGRLWAASFGNGLVEIIQKDEKVIFNTVQNTFKGFPPNGFNKIRCIAEDKSGWIWLGTTNGLLIFNPNQQGTYSFSIYKKVPNEIASLGGNDVQYIYRDTDDKMWVLTATGGLNLALSQNQKSLSFKNYSRKNGLPSDVLLSCLEDDQKNIWIATQNGISKFIHGKQKFQNYNYNDGLENVTYSESSCARTKDGDFVFGTPSGCLIFNPEKISAKKVNAQLALTGLQINSQVITPALEGSPLTSDINETERIVLEHDQNVLGLDFAVLDYHQNERLDYEYRLVGYDDVWRSTEGQTRATYTKLPAGKYLFEVRSLNDERFEKIPYHSLRIVVNNPPWRSWWAYMIYLVMIVGLIILGRKVAITVFKLKQGIVVERQLADLKLGFFTQISHELRTPLTLVINPSEEILKHETLSDRGKAYMTVVVKNTRRMLRMVNQVLDLRKVQSGEGTLRLFNIDVVQFVKEHIDYFRASLIQRNLLIEVNSVLPKLNALIDPEKLEIVLFNALANAIKFSPENGVISITIDKLSEKIFRITVADEGTGVQEHELSDIFRLYYEGKQFGQNQNKGTGIGLALSKELILLHRGKIWAEHNKPNGLKLIIELALGMGNYKLDDIVENTGVHSTPVQLLNGPILVPDHDFILNVEKGEKLRILLVEDNDELREFLTVKFSDVYQIETAKDGAAGLEKVKSLQPDLVLSDIMMPRMDGLQLLEQIKNNPETSHIPVILLTAKYAVESQIEGLKYGADYYITKPFDFQLLETAMEKVLKQRQKVFEQIQQEEELPAEETRVMTQYDQEFLQRVIEVVESKLDDSAFNVEEAADLTRMSRSAFYRKFKSLTGIAPVEFVRDTRVRKGKEILDAGEDNVSMVAYAVGFSTPKYFSVCFKAVYGINPSDYLKKIRKRS